MSLLNPNDLDILSRIKFEIQTNGFCIVKNVLNSEFLEVTRKNMYEVQKKIIQDVGSEKLERAKEAGVLRLMMKYNEHFFQFLKLDFVRQVVDSVLGPTSIMHLQNGFILPPSRPQNGVFQYQFHRDFPRLLNSFLCSLNFLFAIDDFREDNGATLVLPGTQQREVELTDEIRQSAIPAICPAGSVLIFDSTLMHAAGTNKSSKDRLAINHQFTRAYLKQQLDYVRALGDSTILKQDERTQQLLGWYTRLPTSLQEYYVDSKDRLYRGGQG